jgi:hypothetical protein
MLCATADANPKIKRTSDGTSLRMEVISRLKNDTNRRRDAFVLGGQKYLYDYFCSLTFSA